MDRPSNAAIGFNLETQPAAAKDALLAIVSQTAALVEHLRETVLPHLETSEPHYVGRALVDRLTVLNDAALDVLGGGDIRTAANIAQVLDCKAAPPLPRGS